MGADSKSLIFSEFEDNGLDQKFRKRSRKDIFFVGTWLRSGNGKGNRFEQNMIDINKSFFTTNPF
jgi:hypothetical protein